jgi:hypothetical protein
MEITRVCKKCTKEYPLTSEFFKTTKLMPDGFYKTCKKCVAQYTPEYGRMKQMERRYGITVEQYEDMLASQGGHCALCPAVQGTHKRRLTVDHNHACCDSERACGKCNRGILCADCNRKLRFLEHLMRDFTNYENSEVYLRNSVLLDSWTHRALQYLRGYAKEDAQVTKMKFRLNGEGDSA